jgi:hypothetical protein
VVLSLPADTRRETDPERITHGADNLNLGFLGLAVIEHGGPAGTHEPATVVDALSSDHGQGIVDLLQVNLRTVE